ncbi:4'-phosphopantetheinyl transferase family protein [Catenovulum sediminis]|uniref:Enterobactin synthase component D n=1 Tax=Catenovulum sediminis TaxID=1740262 RepID=A0ABV1RMW2_9ALTE
MRLKAVYGLDWIFYSAYGRYNDTTNKKITSNKALMPLQPITAKHARFIKNTLQKMNTDGSVIYACEFDKQAYRDELFTLLNVNFPDRQKKAVVKRRSEFLAGRYMAQLAMRTLQQKAQSSFTNGIATFAQQQVQVGDNREPIWPEGLQGSISHSENKAICVVKPASPSTFIGLDLEHYAASSTANELAKFVMSDTEIALIEKLPLPKHIAFTLVFSAKESLYKALYPYIQQFFGFDCANLLSVDMHNQTLCLELNHPKLATLKFDNCFTCQFSFWQDCLLTQLTG